MATVAVVLKTTKKLTNNEYAVAIRATHERQSRYYPLSTLVTNQSLPWRCRTEDWKPAAVEDNGLGRLRRSFPFYKECNEVLKTKLDEALNILKHYDESNTAFSFDAFEVDLNLTNDPYKGLSLKYNSINRIDSIMTALSSLHKGYITYTYDGAGNVLRKQVYSDSVHLQSTTDYVGGFVYTDSTLSYFPMPEGRVINNAGTLIPEYVISDQQGNARFSFEDDGTGKVKIRQENSYYAFGESLVNSTVSIPPTPNINLYNGGAERQNEFNNLPDYDQTFYRNYDPALGRFIGVDPMPEGAESLTNYNYAGNNPVMFNDPLGDQFLTPRNLGQPTSDVPYTRMDNSGFMNLSHGGSEFYQSVYGVGGEQYFDPYVEFAGGTYGSSYITEADNRALLTQPFSLYGNMRNTFANIAFSYSAIGGTSTGPTNGTGKGGLGRDYWYYPNGDPAGESDAKTNGEDYDSFYLLGMSDPSNNTYNTGTEITYDQLMALKGDGANQGDWHGASGSWDDDLPAWYDIGSKANSIYGFGALAAPLLKSSVAYTKAGAPYFRYYANGWAGYGKAMVGTVRTAEALPIIGFSIGLTLDAVALNNDDIGWGKFSLNTIMGAWGFTVVGTAPSLLYFGIDNWYQGGLPGFMNDYGNTMYQMHKTDPNYNGPTFSY